MQFRIADTFTDSLAKLTGDEQKVVKTTAFDLQMNPAHPGMQFHKLDRAKDPHFWSVRVSRDIRLIVHKTEGSLLLCYVDHHDAAYRWAERRKLETHPTTGAAQFVEIRETVREIVIPTYVSAGAPPKPRLFETIAEEELLLYGVPQEWIGDVRKADEDSLLEIADHLPAEAAEALLELATGGTPVRAEVALAGADPFAHPDALRRFRVIDNEEELAQALEYPWEKWTLFLHPAQRQGVERAYGGPARISGTAGTGKTIVALHRAAFLARTYPDARVLLTTFSEILANALLTKLRRLIHAEPMLGERIEVYSMDAIGKRLYELRIGHSNIASPEEIRALLAEAAAELGGHSFSLRFLFNEWEQVVDAWQLDSWEAYRDVRRLGRKTRLPENQRALLWSIFDRLRAALQARGLTTRAAMFGRLTIALRESQRLPFDFAVVDEAQDIGVAQLGFLAAMVGQKPNGLFLTGDLGQRIFQQPFSWKSLGVDVRGRSRTLRINYRTSHQIRRQADLLLGPEISDVDGNTEDRRGTVSVFNGPAPVIQECDDPETESAFVAGWLSERIGEQFTPQEIGLFVRSEAELPRAVAAAHLAGLPYAVLNEQLASLHDKVSISTMHLAKGLEFRAVAIMGCDDEVIPLQERINSVADESDLEEVYHTERHLLYVACTRARDQLLLTCGDVPSEFLDDLRGR